MGWVGSDALREALADAPCGCDLAEEAEKMRAREPRGAAVLDADAAIAQAAWKCPRTCGDWQPAGLDATHETALVQVRRLVDLDAESLRTCPGAYTRTPDAHEVVRLLRWLKAGALHMRVPYPSAAIVDALDETQDALNAREADELERMKTRKEGDGGK